MRGRLSAKIQHWPNGLTARLWRAVDKFAVVDWARGTRKPKKNAGERGDTTEYEGENATAISRALSSELQAGRKSSSRACPSWLSTTVHGRWQRPAQVVTPQSAAGQAWRSQRLPPGFLVATPSLRAVRPSVTAQARGRRRSSRTGRVRLQRRLMLGCGDSTTPHSAVDAVTPGNGVRSIHRHRWPSAATALGISGPKNTRV